MTGLVVTGTSVLKANKQKTETSFRLNSQSLQFARAGLTEALAWFRRQTSQPVIDFEPIVDLGSSPPILDTDDPDIGIVREFRIAGTIWGRYEVWKNWDADPDPQRLAFRKQMEVRDVSVERSLGAPGTAWSLRSIGYVFRQNDSGVPFDQQPNHVMATRQLETEVLRMKMSLPGQAAICIETGGTCFVENNGWVRGGPTGAGIFHLTGTSPTVNGTVTGTPGISPSPTYLGTLDDVFGTTLVELKSVADDVVTNAADFPSPLPANSLVVSDAGSLVFDSSLPLRGTAIVYVRGDVTIQPGSSSNFSGLLFVDGDLTVNAPAELAGTVMVTAGNDLVVQGAGDWANITFDDGVLASLRKEIGQYRMSGAIRPIDSFE